MRETTSYFAQQALHWGHLVAKNDLDFVTTLLTLDHNWYHNFNPPNGPFPNSYVITHFKVDTIIYKEPTLSTELTSCANHILCIHHKNTSIGSDEHTQQINTLASNLQIPAMFTQAAPSTPPDTLINNNSKWSKVTSTPLPITQTLNIPLITNLEQCLPLKYST